MVECGEIDEAERQVLHQAAMLLNAFDGLLEAADERIPPQAVADGLSLVQKYASGPSHPLSLRLHLAFERVQFRLQGYSLPQGLFDLR
jgi:hypothetical protein